MDEFVQWMGVFVVGIAVLALGIWLAGFVGGDVYEGYWWQ